MSISSIGGSSWIGGYAPSKAASSPSAPTALPEGASDAQDPAVQEFLEFAKMSPGEKIRYLYLRSHGLTEEDLKAMSPEERKAVEDEIAQQIKESVERGTGTGRIADIRV